MIARDARPWAFWRHAVLAAFIAAPVTMSGCRGRAHEDLYRAKMANQIRVLEDQLYDADYQNRVLRDELNRVHQDDRPRSPQPSGSGANSDPVIDRRLSVPQSVPESVPRPTPEAGDYDVLDPNSLNSESPFLDDPQKGMEPTDPTSPRGLPKPPPPPNNASQADDPGKPNAESEKPTTQPLTDPTPAADPTPGTSPSPGGLGMPSETLPTDPVPSPVPDASNSPAMELPAPADLRAPTETKSPVELIPPSEGELIDDQIIPGPPTPPDEDPGSPPGKITRPKDAKTMGFDSSPEEPLPIPDHLELHDGISGGHQLDADAEIDGLYVVVQVTDKAGTPLSLDRFDVDAELTVVVVDPNDTSDDARVGRWEFKPDEVRKMVRQAPVDGIHIPIAWQDRSPTSDDVIVHIRLAAADEEMRCQGRVRLEESVAVSHWLPRG